MEVVVAKCMFSGVAMTLVVLAMIFLDGSSGDKYLGSGGRYTSG